MSENMAPTSAATDSHWYYANASNEPVGPVPFAELERLLSMGVIHAATHIIEVGGSEWKKFASLVPPPHTCREPIADSGKAKGTSPTSATQHGEGAAPSVSKVKKQTARDSLFRCLGLIICILFIWMLFEKGTEKHADKTAASSAKETGFQYIFDGTYASIDGYLFDFDDFIRDIYAGNIPDEMLNHCLIFPSKTYRKSSLALKQALKEHLLFECREYRETYLFAIKRDSFCEPKFQKKLSGFGGNLSGGFSDYLPDEAIAFAGWTEFQTVNGYMRKIPVFSLVANPPNNPPPNRPSPTPIPSQDTRVDISPEQYQKVIKELYNELMNFKNSDRFYQQRFGPLGNFEWKQKYDALNKAKYPPNFDTSALRCIFELAEVYALRHGREDESTKFLSEMIHPTLQSSWLHIVPAQSGN